MKVGLLGGSFNPPHVGHLLAAQYVYATHDVDAVWLMPAYRHPFGKVLAPFEHRLEMCRRLAQSCAPWLRVTEVEGEVGGEGRTVDTLEHLHRTHPGTEWVLIIGSDIVDDLPHWKNVERIRQLAEMFVIHRMGHPAHEAKGPPLVEVSSSDIRGRIQRGEPLNALIPRHVLEYLELQGLYRPPKI